MPNHSIVQSVLLRRSAFKTLDEAKDWITEHGYKYALPDVTPTYYRFRQHAPEPLALTHRLRTTQLGEPEKYSPMGSIGALIIAYPKNTAPLAPTGKAGGPKPKEEPVKSEPKKKSPSGPAAAGAGEPEPKGALARLAGIPEVVRNISSFTQRNEARELIDAAPKTLMTLNKNGDLERIINGTAPKMSPGHYLLESGKERRESVANTGITRSSPFVQGPANYLGVGDENTLRDELKEINKALGIKLGWFILKTTNKTPIRALNPKEATGGTRFLYYFGYEGEVSEKDKELLREVNALIASRGESAVGRQEAKAKKAKEDKDNAKKEWAKKVTDLEDEIVKSMIGGTPKDRRALAERYRASSVKVGMRPMTFKAIDNMPIREIARYTARNELEHLYPR
jgi:hypothetical protein